MLTILKAEVWTDEIARSLGNLESCYQPGLTDTNGEIFVESDEGEEIRCSSYKYTRKGLNVIVDLSVVFNDKWRRLRATFRRVLVVKYVRTDAFYFRKDRKSEFFIPRTMCRRSA